MRLTAAVLLGTFALATAAPSAPIPKEKKGTAEKLLGRWEMTKSDGKAPKDGKYVVEFAKEGKLSLRVEFAGGDQPLVLKGSYKVVDGDKIDYKLTQPDGEDKKEVLAIKKLTDDELVTEDPDGVKEEFKRVKEEKKDDKK